MDMALNINLNIDLAKLAPYMEELFRSIGVRKHHKLLNAAAAEVRGNLAFLDVFRCDTLRGLPINDPQVKRVLTKDLKTAASEQFIACAAGFPQLAARDTKQLLGMLNAVQFKINQMRIYAAKSDKALQRLTRFRPQLRLKNIRSAYIAIKQSFS